MPNTYKCNLVEELRLRFGELKKIGTSKSLFTLGDDVARIYFRYSKVHSGGRTFFGLRAEDLRQLEGHNSFVCFLLDNDSPPTFLPFSDFEEVFRHAQPASDGQYKVQLITGTKFNRTRELYVARQGRFNVEGFIGFEFLDQRIHASNFIEVLDLSHAQVQTLVAGVGFRKGFDVFVPDNDVGRLDWTMTKKFSLRRNPPQGFEKVKQILTEIDVLWIAKGGQAVEGLFEIEHSTPIYSGLLRFNDILLTDQKVAHFTVVSNDVRRALFVRQIARPTFQVSGLAEIVSFLDYRDVFSWHSRLLGGR